MNRIVLILFIIFNTIICVYLWLHWKTLLPDTQEHKNDGIFVPSKEWKPIGKDQPIPKGLHVRINLQTGEREAKLLEPNEESDDAKTSLLSVMDEAEMNDAESDHERWKYNVLRESLKNMKDEANKEKSKINGQPEKKFRTYEQLKEELSELNMKIKTDAEVLNDVLKQFDEKYKSTRKMCTQEEDELMSILKNLENLLHQVDNAEEFSRQNGMSEIVLPCLSSNSTTLRTVSARVLGAAVQNNPKVQIAALKAGVVTPLLKTVALKNNYEARASSIFALSCLMRSFPVAEMTLIEEGGLSVLLALFDETSADALKLQVKVVNLFYDLTLEKEDTEQTIIEKEQLEHNATIDNETALKEMEQVKEKLRQYNTVDLKTKLIESGWCTKLVHLLITRMPSTNFALGSGVNEEAVNHDIVDKVTRGMLSFASECRQQFQMETKFTKILNNLLTYYSRLIAEDELYKDIHKTVQLLNAKLNQTEAL